MTANPTGLTEVLSLLTWFYLDVELVCRRGLVLQRRLVGHRPGGRGVTFHGPILPDERDIYVRRQATVRALAVDRNGNQNGSLFSQPQLVDVTAGWPEPVSVKGE